MSLSLVELEGDRVAVGTQCLVHLLGLRGGNDRVVGALQKHERCLNLTDTVDGRALRPHRV